MKNTTLPRPHVVYKRLLVSGEICFRISINAGNTQLRY